MEKITEDEKIAREIDRLGEMYDPEAAHVQADRLLVKILEKHGYHSTIAAFNLLLKYYS